MRIGFKIFDPAAGLRKEDRSECLEFALLSAIMIVLIAATYALSLVVDFDAVDFYLGISFIAAAGGIYRAHDAWRHSRMPSLERTRIEEARALRLQEQEEAVASRPSSWAERIAKSESEA